MKAKEALESVWPVKGMTTMISGILSRDWDSIRGPGEEATSSLLQVEAALERANDAQANCKSDAAYWGYMGDISYLRATRDILKAIEICGDDLPDVPKPNRDGVVMDLCSQIERFGSKILRLAKARAQPDSEVSE